MDNLCLWIYYHSYVELLTEANPNPDFLAFVWDAGKVTKTVSYAEFEDYYEGLSIEIPDDEEYINDLRAAWSIWGHLPWFWKDTFGLWVKYWAIMFVCTVCHYILLFILYYS